VRRGTGPLPPMALQSSHSHTPSSPPPAPTPAGARESGRLTVAGVLLAILYRSPPEQAPDLGRAPAQCRQALIVRLSCRRLLLTPPMHQGGAGGSEEEAVGGDVGRSGRRVGDAYEVRVAVGHCEARHRALTAHGASIIAIQEWVGNSSRASPSFQSNVHMPMGAR